MSQTYINPLTTRYAGPEMQHLFSDDHKFGTWRRLWLALAEAQKDLGLEIPDAALDEMRQNLDTIDYDKAKQYESELRHDVMAHIHTFGDAAPSARGIIHLGATSAFVGDNTDLILQKEALLAIREGLVALCHVVAEFADTHAALPVLAYTHFQAAQPTTLGKRATLWLHDLMMDLERLDDTLGHLKFLGCRGTTGTGASFLALFNGDATKVTALEHSIATRMGFDAVYPVSGQTYSRKVDYHTLQVLSGIAQTTHKMANDIRLMAHLKAVDEPFEAHQVGSSAMAYKRNPMRAERITALARYLIVDTLNPALTASEQWFERTLDDSANRRIAIPEAFLAADAILRLARNIVGGMKVYPAVFARQLHDELPFMITENILMAAVQQGGDRQAIHERIRVHSLETARAVKEDGQANDLLDRLANDPDIPLTRADMDRLMHAEALTGLAEAQTRDYLDTVRTALGPAPTTESTDALIRV